MNISQLIEQDMVRFLESASQRNDQRDVPRQEDAAAMQRNRDWEFDVKQALKRNDLDEAKRLFNELKQRYNETPEQHETERRHLFDVIQQCYVSIINFVQERVRTTELIRTMEQSPGDVFDTRVRPVDLQRAGRIEETIHVKLDATTLPVTVNPTAAPVIVQMAPAAYAPPMNVPAYAPSVSSTPPALPSLPPTPSAPSVFTAPPPPVAMTPAPIMMAPPVYAAPPPTVQPELSPSQRAQKALQQAAASAKTEPSEALALLTQAKQTIEAARTAGSMDTAQATALASKADALREAIDAEMAHRTFLTVFNQQFADLLKLCRQKDRGAMDAYRGLQARASNFEHEHTEYAGGFTTKLAQLQRTYGLYDEDGLVDALRPILLRLKIARSKRDAPGYVHALRDFASFTATLPHTQERELLEQAISKLERGVSKGQA